MKKLVIYLTFLYPNEEEFLKTLRVLEEEKVDIVELGIPVKDPFMDGGVIKDTHLEVLKTSPDVHKLVSILEYIKRNFSFKVVLMTYYEGVKAFNLLDSARGLCHGLLCVDKLITKKDFPSPIQLYNEGMTEEEMKSLAKENELFSYVMSGVGKTGSFKGVPTGYIETIKTLKSFSNLPAYVGFGIKTPQDAIEVCSNGAEGIIIGSHFIKILQEKGLEGCRNYVKELKEVL